MSTADIPRYADGTPAHVGDMVRCLHGDGFIITDQTPDRQWSKLRCGICQGQWWEQTSRLTKEAPHHAA